MYANYFWVFSFSAVRWTSQVTIITAYNTGFEKQKTLADNPQKPTPQKLPPFQNMRVYKTQWQDGGHQNHKSSLWLERSVVVVGVVFTRCPKLLIALFLHVLRPGGANSLRICCGHFYPNFLLLVRPCKVNTRIRRHCNIKRSVAAASTIHQVYGHDHYPFFHKQSLFNRFRI